jgi:hypothetical protein
VVITDTYFDELDKHMRNNPETPLGTQWMEQLNDTEHPNYYDGYHCLYLPNEIDINVNLYKQSTFLQKLNETWLQALMCIYLPQEHILRHDIQELAPENVTIYHKKLARSVAAESDKHFRMAKRKWKKEENHRTGKKMLIHTIRGLQFGIQIVQHERIIDYKCANELYHEIMSRTDDDWNVYEQAYKPQYHELRDHFIKILLKDKMMIANKHVENVFNIVQYLENTNGSMEPLTKFLALKLTQHGSLVHICDTPDSTNGSPVVIECGNGLLLDENQVVVSKSVSKVLNCLDRHKPIVDWKTNVTAHVTRSVNMSVLVTMYYYESEWRIHTESTPDASETLSNGDHTVSVRELFWKLFGSCATPIEEDQNKCFVFRLDTYNYLRARKAEDLIIDKYVLREEKGTLHLQCVIDKSISCEIEMQPFAQKYQWPYVSEFGFTFDKLQKLQNYCFGLSPLEVTEVWYHDEKLRRVCVLNAQRESLMTLLTSYPTLPTNGERLVLDIVRATYYDQNASLQVEMFISQHYCELVTMFDNVKKRFGAICDYLDDIYQQAKQPENGEPVDQKTFISRVNAVKLEEKFDNNVLKRVRDTVFSALSALYKNEHELPKEVDVSRVSQYFAYRQTDRGVYPLLYNAWK